jgi:hypothetical protein
MDIKRRFVFFGNAAAYGGRLVRPADIVIEARGGSSLPVTGGRCQSALQAVQFGDFIRVGSATTFAEGLFDDLKQAVEASFGRVRPDTLTTTTTVNAEVHDIVVGTKPRLSVKRLRAALVSKSPTASDETGIRMADDSAVQGVDIDGHILVVELATKAFQQYDTYSKLRSAADDPVFARDNGDCLLTQSVSDGRPAPPSGRLVEGRAGVYATIVKNIRWDGEPFPGATIDHHLVTVPNFGKIFFGEIFIKRDSRRLTMMRLELGSPDGGDAAFAEVEDNGIWSP